MSVNKNALIIFELNNTQCHYSICLEQILNLEQYKETNSLLDLQEKINSLNTISIKVYECSKNLPSPKYFEQPMMVKNKSSIMSNTISPLVHLSKQINYDIIKNIKSGAYSEIKYHLRIKNASKESTIINLQFLALLLQKLEYLFKNLSMPKKRISVFLLPNTNYEYPFKKDCCFYSLTSMFNN